MQNQQVLELQSWMAATIALLPLLLMIIPIALFAFLIAPRVNGNRALWTLFSVIPLINFIMMYYMMYRIVAHGLDRINAISARVQASDK